jgi:hypothetical protein
MSTFDVKQGRATPWGQRTHALTGNTPLAQSSLTRSLQGYAESILSFPSKAVNAIGTVYNDAKGGIGHVYNTIDKKVDTVVNTALNPSSWIVLGVIAYTLSTTLLK